MAYFLKKKHYLRADLLVHVESEKIQICLTILSSYMPSSLFA